MNQFTRKIVIACVAMSFAPALVFADTISQMNAVIPQLVQLLSSLQGYVSQLPSPSGGIGPESVSQAPNYFQRDQGGSIELGKDVRPPAWKGDVGVPYIDFHYLKNTVQDFDTRIINDDAGQLTFSGAKRVSVNGGAILHVAGNTQPKVDTQGAYIGWNALTGGTGETDFINNQGLGAGGFAFFNIPSPQTTPVTGLWSQMPVGNKAPIVQISPKGNLELGNQYLPAAGITLRDEVGGAQFCVKIRNAQLQAIPGACN